MDSGQLCFLSPFVCSISNQQTKISKPINEVFTTKKKLEIPCSNLSFIRSENSDSSGSFALVSHYKALSLFEGQQKKQKQIFKTRLKTLPQYLCITPTVVADIGESAKSLLYPYMFPIRSAVGNKQKIIEKLHFYISIN
jgi:hypothetical protein